jgi:hypothetical protein
MLVDENPCFWQKHPEPGHHLRALGLELLSFKMRDFHSVPVEGRSTIAFGYESAANTS